MNYNRYKLSVLSDNTDDIISSDIFGRVSSKLYYKKYGVEGIYQTVELMKNLVNKYKKDKRIRLLTLGILMKARSGRNKLRQAIAIYNSVVNNINYVSDITDIETIQSPDITIKTKSGDCDDMSTLTATMLSCIGINYSFVIAGYNKEKIISHVYVIAYIAGKKYILDTAYGKGFNVERKNYTIKKIL